MPNNEPVPNKPNWKNATESKLKHLEIIQAVITRMANNSFMVKGWCLTLISALLALAGGKDANTKLVYVTYLPLFMFWYLDGFFLQQEQLFRKVYDYTRLLPETDFAVSPMDIPEEIRKKVKGVIRVMLSKTLLPFYGATLIAVGIATAILEEPLSWLKSILHIG